MIQKKYLSNQVCTYICFIYMSGVMVTVVKNGHSNLNSNSGESCWHFTLHWYSLERYESNYPAIGK